MLKTMAAALAALALVACGGGGDSANTQVQAVSVQQTHFLAIEYGDSTVAGYTPPIGTQPAVFNPPVDEAQAALRRATGRPDAQVVGEGHGATGAAQMLYGTDFSGLVWADRVDSVSSTVIAIRTGLNDNAMPMEDFRWAYSQLVGIAKAHGKVVLIETPTPMVDGVGVLSNLSSIPRHDAKVQAIRDIAAATGTALCDINLRIRERHLDTLDNFPDGIHGTPAVYAFIGDELAKCLVPLVH